MFEDAPIAIHHDFSKSNLDVASLPSRTVIVKDWVRTEWGTLSLIDAYLAALRLLHNKYAPEWTVSLSGTDYPIKPAEYILSDLRSTTSDAFLDAREIRKEQGLPAELPSHRHYSQPEWLTAAWGRYLGFSLVHYHVRKLLGRADRPFYFGNAVTTRLFTPFSESFRVYGGDTWHTINRRAAAVLMADDERSHKLMRHYKDRIVPDESYYHTLLLNRPELMICDDHRRFSIWGDAPHPKVLGLEDIPAMMASTAHFARKFPFDRELYDAVDRAAQVLVSVPPGNSQTTRHA